MGATLLTAGLIPLVLGCSQAEGGTWLSPQVLGLLRAAFLFLSLFVLGRYKGPAVGGSLLLALGMYLATTLGPATPAAAAVRDVILIGLGSGVVMPVLNVAVQNAFPYRLMGMVSATQQFVQSLGGSSPPRSWGRCW